MWVSPQIVDSSLSNKKHLQKKKSFAIKQKKSFVKVMWSLSSAFFSKKNILHQSFLYDFPSPKSLSNDAKKCMHSKLFSFLIVMSKLSSRRRESSPIQDVFLSCLSFWRKRRNSRVFLREEKSFIISRKLSLSCCTFRYVDGVEEEQKSMESCTKMMSFVFKSFRRNNQSFVANLEVFQEKSFIILIVRKFSMESLMIGHEIHKKLLLSRCWDSNGEMWTSVKLKSPLS